MVLSARLPAEIHTLADDSGRSRLLHEFLHLAVSVPAVLRCPMYLDALCPLRSQAALAAVPRRE